MAISQKDTMKKVSAANEQPTILIPFETARASSRRLLMGIVEYARKRAHWKFFFSEPMYYPKCYTTEAFINNLKVLSPSAVFTYINDARVVEVINKLGISAVIIPLSEPIEGIPNLLENWDETGRMGAEYFISKGHINFAYAGFKNLVWSEQRRKSYVDCIEQIGGKVNVYEKIKAVQKHNWKLEDKRMANWLQKLPKPVGVMCCNDDFAQQLLNSCEIAGLSVPEEVAILGVDNDELVCELSNPPLSSIVMDHNKVGFQIGRLLDRLISGKKWDGKNIFINPVRIVTRKSTDYLAISDREVVKAIHFIEKNSLERNLTVEDVVDSTFVSRRTLEKRFQDNLKCSIYSKIKQIRVSHFMKYLLETNMPVYEIATKMGFKEIKHVSKYFREETGMSPVTFRKKYQQFSFDH